MPKKDKMTKILFALSIAWQLGFLIAATIGGFLFLGHWLDEKLGTSPTLLVISIVLGIGVTIYETYHLLSFLIKKRND